MARHDSLTICSFCGKNHSEVRKLIAGPGVYICDNCITVCKSILDKESREELWNKNQRKGYEPAQIKHILDEHVVGQEHAKVAIWMAIHNFMQGKQKNNVFMIGPVGSGKTQFAKAVKAIFKTPVCIPVCIYDATTLLEPIPLEEIFGRMFLQLVQNADFDIHRAQSGVVFIKSIDRVTLPPEGLRNGREVCIQKALATILNGTCHKISNENRGQPWKQEYKGIITDDILFICCGELSEFGMPIRRKKSTKTTETVGPEERKQIRINSGDLINSGMIPELIASFPTITELSPLTEDELVMVLNHSSNMTLTYFIELFQTRGICLNITKDAIKAFAAKATEQSIGAHGLRSIVERLMLDILFEIPSDHDIDQITINRAVVEGNRLPLIKKNTK
jgi:ATP-dependent Clp protease ATP-binding subunit ClpX